MVADAGHRDGRDSLVLWGWKAGRVQYCSLVEFLFSLSEATFWPWPWLKEVGYLGVVGSVGRESLGKILWTGGCTPGCCWRMSVG